MTNFTHDITHQFNELDAGKPFWQSGQCPAWCQVDHAHSDHPGDRKHLSGWTHQVVLSLQPESFADLRARRADEKEQGLPRDSTFEPEFLSIHLEQGYREIGPRVWLGVGESNQGHWLTPEEAKRLAEALTSATRAAQQPSAAPVAHLIIAS